MSKYLDSLFGLKGKVAIVVGASRGIGMSIAEGLQNAGAEVYGFGRTETSALNKTPKFEYKSVDFLKNENIEKEFSSINIRKGSINILVNAAGITIPNDNSMDSFRETFKTNLYLAYESSIMFSELKEDSSLASIINITSIGAEIGFPNNPAYIASKAALKNMTKGLAIDFASKNIRVNNISPGYIDTAMTKESLLDAEKKEKRLNRMIIKRWGKTKDIVGASIFLASDSSSYMTGTDITIDGGWIANGLTD